MQRENNEDAGSLTLGKAFIERFSRQKLLKLPQMLLS